jgi:sterol desaturase/sphingolipid hydroxylase (fatty acid hydroxylase superfamily)
MLVPLIVLCVAIAMMACEAACPGRSWPAVSGWWLRAALLNCVQASMVLVFGHAWRDWLIQHRLWSADCLGVVGGAVAGYLVFTFLYYWWHRWRHESPFLWRWLHQLHHSPQRVEIITSFYKHPFELLANSVLSSIVAYMIVGLGPEAAVGTVLLGGLAELFYHWNVATPYWLGFIVQRPESHCVHHQEGVHSHNYADLPIWDMLFGTFRNPRQWDDRCGFGPSQESRVLDMLGGVNLNAHAEPPAVEVLTPRQPAWRRAIKYAAPVFLLALGLLQMSGDVLGMPILRGAGAVTTASPAPKVFTKVRGLESFSAQFFLEWTDSAGVEHSLHVTPEVNARLRGPYNRRNVYGAVLAGGPQMVSDPILHPMFAGVTRYGFSGRAPLLRELGIDPATVQDGTLRIRLKPVPGTNPRGLPLVLEVPEP